MLPIILITGFTIIALFLAVAALQKPEFCVTRSATIHAPASVVFEQVNDLHNWNGWSPWARMDPAAKQTYEGPSAGVGASFAWSGNKVGAGKMTIIESHPVELVRMSLHFIKPFAARNLAEFTFKPEGDTTILTWSMSGKNNLLGKAMHLVMNCDKMCGDQFEQGFSNLNERIAQESLVH